MAAAWLLGSCWPMPCGSCSSVHGFERAAGVAARNEALSGKRLEPPPVVTGGRPDSWRDRKFLDRKFLEVSRSFSMKPCNCSASVRLRVSGRDQLSGGFQCKYGSVCLLCPARPSLSWERSYNCCSAAAWGS